MIVAVALRRIPPFEFRQTLFVLWIFLVMVKMTAFVIANVPIFYDAVVLLLPFAWLGHISGNRLHRYILSKDISSIQQTIGLVLLVSALIGLIKIYL
jgi:hypothetical protein